MTPDPRKFNLPEDYIYIEKPWGSMFYKHHGKQNIRGAKQSCSLDGDLVHLPIPRFKDENEFYQKHFGVEKLWLDIYGDFSGTDFNGDFVEDSRDIFYGDFVDEFGNIFIRQVQTIHEIENIINHSWIKLNFSDSIDPNDDQWIDGTPVEDQIESIVNDPHRDPDSTGLVLTASGEWRISWSDEIDTVCVYNIIPNENCSKCHEEAFCRYTDAQQRDTECVCPIERGGENCQEFLCDHCLNGGHCRQNNDEQNEAQLQCICPKPFFGENCQLSK